MDVRTGSLHNPTMTSRRSPAAGTPDQSLAIRTYGVDSRHRPDWICNRPQGSGDYLIMCFTTPFLALTSAGRQRGGPGDCLINTPDFPNWHGSVPQAADGFRNDYIHLAGGLVPALLRRYQLPLNTLFHVGDAHVMGSLLEEVQRDQRNNEAFCQDAQRCRIELLLLALARASTIHAGRRGPTRGELAWRPRFQDFRARLHAEYREPWRVAGMAKRLGLSENRFCALYRGFFQVSPVEDLIRVRIEQAKQMLANSAATQAAVAEACGFASVFYFARVFRQRVGITPGHFASRHGSSRQP